MWDSILLPLGFVVGFLVGLTGVGGGALMTPALVWYGVPPLIAVGTDLIYAALTKSVGVVVHQFRANVRWWIVGWLCLGSVPGSLLSLWFIEAHQMNDESFDSLITVVLGLALVLTAVVTLAKRWIIQFAEKQSKSPEPGNGGRHALTVIAGFVIGVMVTFSSVGAGALGAAILLLLFPRLPMSAIVGTDLAHAVLLVSVAGIGHIGLGTVEFSLLTVLLLGSLPGVYLGSICANRIPDDILRPLMAAVLLSLGTGFTWSYLV